MTATETGVVSTVKPATTEIPQGYTTSTVYSTKVYTVTSCAATVTDCPAKIGSVTTEVVAVSTTICPITEATAKATGSTSAPGIKAVSSASSGSGSSPSGSYSAVPVSSFTTAYVTIPVYPTGKSNSTIAATGTVKVPASSSGVAAGTGKASSYAASSTAPIVPATTSYPATAGSSRTVFSLGAVVMALALAF